MSDRLKGKVAVVTGGASGIGAATALLVLASDHGINVSGQNIVIDGGRTVGGFINPRSAPPPRYNSLPSGFKGATTGENGQHLGSLGQGVVPQMAARE